MVKPFVKTSEGFKMISKELSWEFPGGPGAFTAAARPRVQSLVRMTSSATQQINQSIKSKLIINKRALSLLDQQNAVALKLYQLMASGLE